jgi:hypothetical protein
MTVDEPTPAPFERARPRRWIVRLELDVEVDVAGGSVTALRRVLTALEDSYPIPGAVEVVDAQVEAATDPALFR